MKLEFGVDAAIGPGIDLNNSDKTTGKITIFKPNIIGLYVEKDQRFNLSVSRSVDLVSPEWRQVEEKALAVLPRLPKKSN